MLIALEVHHPYDILEQKGRAMNYYRYEKDIWPAAGDEFEFEHWDWYYHSLRVFQVSLCTRVGDEDEEEGEATYDVVTIRAFNCGRTPPDSHNP